MNDIISSSIERWGGAGGNRERGDRGTDIAEASCCRVPVYPCPRIRPWESRTMVAVAVQGALHGYIHELGSWLGKDKGLADRFQQ